jgi:hypothetical protein
MAKELTRSKRSTELSSIFHRAAIRMSWIAVMLKGCPRGLTFLGMEFFHLHSALWLLSGAIKKEVTMSHKEKEKLEWLFDLLFKCVALAIIKILER